MGRLRSWIKRASVSSKFPRAVRARLDVERLLDRVMPASTSLAGGVLTISYSAASEAVTVTNSSGDISLGGSTFTGAGTGAFSGVNRIVVSDAGALVGQSLTFNGAAFFLASGLDVTGVESVIFNQGVDVSGGANPLGVSGAQSILVNAGLAGGSGGVSFSAANGIVLNDAVTAGGAVSFNADSDANGAGTMTLAAPNGSFLGGSIATTAGGITINVADADVQGAISGPATVTIATAQAGRAIDLGTNVAGLLGLTDAELDRVSASQLVVGNSSSGAMTVSAALTTTSNLSLVTGAAFTVNQSMALGTDRNLTANAVGAINLSGASSDIVAGGSGAVSLTTTSYIVLSSGSSISVVNGNLDLNGNVSGAGAGNYNGIMLSGAKLTTSGTGNVKLIGQGGDQAGVNWHSGVRLESQAVIESTASGATAGTITLNGQGGGGQHSNIGVNIQGAGTLITSVSGAIQLVGIGASGTGSYNEGVAILNDAKVTSTGVGATAATITINGTGGGMSFFLSQQNYGTEIHGANGAVSTVDGAVNIIGTSGLGQFGYGFLFGWNGQGGNLRSTGAANIEVISDKMLIWSGSINAGANTLTLRQKINGTTINIGGDDAAGVLGIDELELTFVSAGTLQIGNANTGAITVSEPINLTDGPVVPVLSLTTSANIIDATAVSNDFVVAGLNITAPTGIGASANPLEVSVSTFSANTSGGNGSQYLTHTGPFTVGSAGLNSGNGTIFLSGVVAKLASGGGGLLGNLLVNSGAALDLNGVTASANVTLNGTGVGGAGALINTSAAAGAIGGTTSLASAVTVATTNGGIDLQGKVTGAGVLTKVGVGNLALMSSANDFSGNVAINDGILTVTANNALGTTAGATTIGSAGQLRLQGGVDYTAAETLIFNGGVFHSTLGPNSFAGPVTLNANVSIMTDGSQAGVLPLSGGISGGFGITKLDTEVLTLSGVNSYVGATDVGAGKLLVNGSLTQTSGVIVADGATLGGGGVISGPVTVQSGGTLAPGNSIGTLTINNTLALGGIESFEVTGGSGPLGSSDRVVGVTSLTYGGTLKIVNVGAAFANGDSWNLFDFTGQSGAFANNNDFNTSGDGTNLPMLSGLVWKFNYATGVLSIVPSTVTNPTHTAITGTGATLGGTVTSDGGSPITERGVAYSTSPNPTTAGPKVTSPGTTGTFTVDVTDLTPGVLYHYRAYAINGLGTTYSSGASFTTPNAVASVDSPTHTAITDEGATLGGTVTSDGGSTITERGVAYSLSANPTLADAKVTDPGTTGTFTVGITGLTPGVLYHYRAYAINGAGVAFSSDDSFTTMAVAPTVTSPTKSSITGVGATLGGTVVADGGGTITERGVVYSLSANPTLADAKVTDTGTTGTFTVGLTGLAPGVLYHYRAYATNSVGTTYTSDDSFTTLMVAPTVASPTKSSITGVGATLGGTVSADGGATIAERGVVYSLSANPTLADLKVTDTGTTGAFTVGITGLAPGVLYHYRAYATNAVGTTYTNDDSFTTLTVAPTVTSPTKSSITGVGATLGGTVSADGGATIIERGVVYSLSTNPTLADAKVTDTGTTGTFTVGLTGLAPGVLYHYRAYATNSVGTTYTSDDSFTTLMVAPTVASPTKSSITGVGATLGGTVSADGGATIIERGVVYSLSTNPTLADAKVTDAGTTGTFTVGVTGLAPGVLYHYRAYATNSVGTTYTSDDSFTTLTVAPTVTSPTKSSITGVGATLGGTVSADGGATITERGVVYSLSANPTLADAKVTDPGTTGTFTVGLTGLAPGVLYHYRAYATNAVGTTYTSDDSFTTLTVAPTVTSPTKSSITGVGATLGGTVDADGGATITERGVVYSLSSNPTLADAKVTDAGTTGTFTVGVTGLAPGVLYHYRAYATNSVGTTYTNDDSFTTLTVAPTVTSPTKSSVTGVGATLGGTVSADGGATITERGIVYSLSSNPTLADAKVTDTGTTGTFTVGLTGLAPGVLYYYRAYATNSVGTTYTSDDSFTTLTVAPTVASPTKASITGVGATLGGTVSADGGATIAERGVVYSLSANPTLADAKVTDPGTTGTFTVGLTGLAPGVLYHYRAYATNAVGTTYTSDDSFTTLTVAPTVTSPTKSSITGVGATLGGTVDADGGATITERGVVYSLSSNPTLADAKVTDAGTTGTFTVGVTGLAPGVLYYYRAYATNSVGTTYTNDDSFTTLTVAPTVTSPTKASITGVGATLGGTVSADGGATIIERGVVYSLSTNPTLADAKVTDTGTTGTFTVGLTGLAPGVLYYYRAYATNSVGTTYTSDDSFTTLMVAPTVASPTKSSITGVGATLGGTVSADGGATIIERGVVYSLSTNPTLADAKVTDAGTTGTFTVGVTGLAPGVLYHYRAYATNAVGTTYTSDDSFTTLTVAPTVTSPTKSSITGVGATLGGTVDADGGATITERGVVYSLSSNPTLADAKVTDAGTTGTFTVGVTGLAPGVLYYYRAYATNSVGTTYTNDDSFTTLTVAPTVTSPTKSSITGVGATLGGTVSADGGATIIERGVVYSLSTNPTLADAKVTDTGTTGTFTVGLTGLAPGVLYHYRAYATNSVGTTYTSDDSFTTLTVAPTVASPTKASITGVGATLGGTVSADGGATIAERGVVYSLSANPTLADAKVTDPGTTGTFTVGLTGLAPGVLYHYRAYATNAVGTTYTSDDSFTTLTVAPTVTSPTKSSITGVGATLGGTVDADGGATITERGVVYSLSSNPTLADAKVTDAGTTGTFTVGVTGLAPGVLYYYRAYATNSVGTTYTNDDSFTTLTVAPTVTSPTKASITGVGATLGGTVAADGGATITERGVVYSLSANPTLADAKVTDPGTTGTFTVGLTGLAPGVLYHYRAYATNSVGTTYSSDDSFTTLVVAPTVTSVAPFIGPTSGGNTVIITGDGFTAATAVRFAGVSATSFTVNSATKITAVAAAGTSIVSVSVTNTSGTSDTAGVGDDYTYATPTVTSVVVNGGDIVARNKFNQAPALAGQSSVVSQILASFNMPVTLDAGAFTVESLASSVTASGVSPTVGTIAVTATGVPSSQFAGIAGFSQYVLTFQAGAVVNTHSPVGGNTFTTLQDGFYRLDTVGSKVHAGSGTVADRSDKFWSLYGAVNVGDIKVTGALGGGDDQLFVDGLALNDMYATFGSRLDASVPPYNTSFDWNLDGFVDGIDLNRLYANFGTIWTLGGTTGPAPSVTSVVVNGVAVQTLTGATWTSGNPLVTVASTTGLVAGAQVSSFGAGFPAHATIVSVDGATTFTLSSSPTGTQSTATTIRAANAPKKSGTVLQLAGATWTNGSANVTVASTTGLLAGQYVSSAASGLPTDVVVASVTNATTFVLSSPATSDRLTPTTIDVANGAIARDQYGSLVDLSGTNTGSSVEHILVTFNQKVTLDANAFAIANLGSSITSNSVAPATGDVAVVAAGITGTGDEATGYTQYVLNFAAGTATNSFTNSSALGNAFTTLKNGLFRLDTVGSKVHAVGGTGANRSDSFWSLYGVVNAGDILVTGTPGGGDDELRVDGLALNDMYATFGSFANATTPPYNRSFDRDFDGDVDGVDLNQLYSNFGTIWRF